MVAVEKKEECLSGGDEGGRLSRRLRGIVHEPVSLHSDCLICVLKAYFGNSVEILEGLRHCRMCDKDLCMSKWIF